MLNFTLGFLSELLPIPKSNEDVTQMVNVDIASFRSKGETLDRIRHVCRVLWL